MQPWFSLRRKLPLLISTLLCVVVTAVCWSAYRQVEDVLVQSMGTRLTSVAPLLADMLEGASWRVRRQARQVAADSAVVAALSHPSVTSRRAAQVVLEREQAESPQAVSFALWSRNGTRVLATGPLVPSGDGQPTPPTTDGVGPLVRVGDGVVFEVATPVLAGARDTIGMLATYRRISSGESATLIGELIGSNASLLVGNADGPPLWTDFTTVVEGPPRALQPGTPTEYRATDGERLLGVMRPIPGTPWLVLVHSSRAAALAPARGFVLYLVVVALCCIALGTAGAWVLSHRITAPLAEVTRAAADVARGDYTRRVQIVRRDEVGSLASSFNSMAAQVEAAAHDLMGYSGELRAANADLQESEERYRGLVEAAHVGICAVDPEGRITYANARLAAMLGYAVEELRARAITDFMEPQSAEARARFTARDGAGAETREVAFRRQDGARLWTQTSVSSLFDAAARRTGALFMLSDVTEERSLEMQLHQAQKMDAVGQLAAGVAHDFNNLLTVMTIYTGLVLDDMRADDPTRADLEEVRRATERAASLTRQLLAFSRQQVLQPRVLDVNHVVRGLEAMLTRVLREDVRLETSLAPSLGPVYADPGQLEQVIVNLAVNARDAMPGGGALTIETADVELDVDYARLHAQVTPGPYVMVAVSDTGTGMDAATQARMFEPFFTTKEDGKGTGLGLSTVYGIVKQSGGHVGVYSEPGVGTSLKIYLPRDQSAPAARPRSGALPALHRGSGTILLTEDEAPVRRAARRILERAGYTVLEAASGVEALRVCEAHAAPIDLLLTDIVMPDMNGRELTARFRALHPRAATVFMSGYTADAALRQEAFEPGTVFIEKPFTPQTLTQKLREALDVA